MNILQRIFTDYYEIIKYTLHPRKTEMENIDKMINCGDPSFGGAMYICTHCKNWKFVPFRCHSRFCPTCGNKYAMERTTSMSFKLVNVNHRHCVFTIDENLRAFRNESAAIPVAASRRAHSLGAHAPVGIRTWRELDHHHQYANGVPYRRYREFLHL